MTPDIREADSMPNPARARSLIAVSIAGDLRNRRVAGDATVASIVNASGPICGRCDNILTIRDRGDVCRQCLMSRGS